MPAAPRGDPELAAVPEARRHREARLEHAGRSLHGARELARVGVELERPARRGGVPGRIDGARRDDHLPRRIAVRGHRFAIERERHRDRSPGQRADADDRLRRGGAGEPHREPLLARGARRQRPDHLERACLARRDRDRAARRLEHRHVPAPRRAVRRHHVRDDPHLLGAVGLHRRAVRDGVDERRLGDVQVDGPEAVVRLAHTGRDDDGDDRDPVLAGDPRPERAIADAQRDGLAGARAHARVALSGERDREPAVERARRAAGGDGDNRDLREALGGRLEARGEPARREPPHRLDPAGARRDRDLRDLRRRPDPQVGARVAPEHEPRRLGDDAQRAAASGGGLALRRRRGGRGARRGRGGEETAREHREDDERPGLSASQASHSTRSRPTRSLLPAGSSKPRRRASPASAPAAPPRRSPARARSGPPSRRARRRGRGRRP